MKHAQDTAKRQTLSQESSDIVCQLIRDAIHSESDIVDSFGVCTIEATEALARWQQLENALCEIKGLSL